MARPKTLLRGSVPSKRLAFFAALREKSERESDPVPRCAGSLPSMPARASIQNMASLSVRKIDEEIYERLRVRAAEHGVSMEEEVRRIIARAVSAPERLGELALRCFGPDHGIELEIGPRKAHEPLDLGR